MLNSLMNFPFLATLIGQQGPIPNDGSSINNAAIDILHAYSQYFQRDTIISQIIRVVEAFIFQFLYNVDYVICKVVFTILGINTAANGSSKSDDFNGSILGLLNAKGVQDFILVGVSLGGMVLALFGLYIYGKILLGKKVDISNMLTNGLTSLVLLISLPVLLSVSIRTGSYFFVGLATRNISENANGQYQVNNSKTSIEDFVWNIVQPGIINTGKGIYSRDYNKGYNGPYYGTMNDSGSYSPPDSTLLNPNKGDADTYLGITSDEAIFNNYPVRYVAGKGAQPTVEGEQNIVNVIAQSDKDTVTSDWVGQLSSQLVTPSDAKGINPGLMPSSSSDGKTGDSNNPLTKMAAFFKKVTSVVTNQSIDDPDNHGTLWGALTAYTYKTNAYDPTVNVAGGHSMLMPVGAVELIASLSPNHYFQYALNPAYIIVLICVGLLLLDILYKLLVAFFDIIVAIFTGLPGMAMTMESGRGNAVFIESILGYGKICIVSGASIFLFITAQAYVPGMFANSGLNGGMVFFAEPILLALIAMIFLNGSQVFVKMFGVDAGFSMAGGLFGAYLGRGLVRRAANKAGNAVRGATNGAKKAGGALKDSVVNGDEKENSRLTQQAEKINNNVHLSDSQKEAKLSTLQEKGSYQNRIHKAISTPIKQGFGEVHATNMEQVGKIVPAISSTIASTVAPSESERLENPNSLRNRVATKLEDTSKESSDRNATTYNNRMKKVSEAGLPTNKEVEMRSQAIATGLEKSNSNAAYVPVKTSLKEGNVSPKFPIQDSSTTSTKQVQNGTEKQEVEMMKNMETKIKNTVSDNKVTSTTDDDVSKKLSDILNRPVQSRTMTKSVNAGLVNAQIDAKSRVNTKVNNQVDVDLEHAKKQVRDGQDKAVNKVASDLSSQNSRTVGKHVQGSNTNVNVKNDSKLSVKMDKVSNTRSLETNRPTKSSGISSPKLPKK